MNAKELLDQMRLKVAKEIVNERTMYKYWHNKKESDDANLKEQREGMSRCINRMMAFEDIREWLDEKFIELMEEEDKEW